MIYKSILLLAFAFVSTKGGPLFDPCYKDDLSCLKKATETFMSKTYGGVTDMDIKPIDPLIIPSLEVNVDDAMGLVFNFKNLNITGLRNLKIDNFKMNVNKRTVLLKMKVDLIVSGDLEVKLTKLHKTFEGLYTATATAFGTSNYGYHLKTINGTEYFEVGPEINSCEIHEEPEVTLGTYLQSTLDKDQDALNLKPEWEAKRVALRKKTLCSIIDASIVSVIHNLRSVAKVFPKTAFFKDI